MLRKIKYSKIAIVIFLTILIWVWADLALDETFPVPGATIIVAESNPNLWVSFGGKASISIDNIVLKGPASKIAEMKRELSEGTLNLKFSLYPELEEITAAAAGPFTLNVLDFIKGSAELRELSGLTAETCDPNTLTLDVVKLVERPLTVQCIDESGNSQKYESIEPSTVNALVPSDWGLDKLIAQVKLTRNEIEEARKAPIKKIPYIELSAEQIRESSTAVTIKLAPEEDPLTVQRIEDATIGIAMSPTLSAKYYADITNLSNVLNSLAVKATTDAKRAYEGQQLPQMTLYIFESDIKQGQEDYRKAVHYNFPEKYVRTGEIELMGGPTQAEFQLKTRPTAESE